MAKHCGGCGAQYEDWAEQCRECKTSEFLSIEEWEHKVTLLSFEVGILDLLLVGEVRQTRSFHFLQDLSNGFVFGEGTNPFLIDPAGARDLLRTTAIGKRNPL